HHGLGVGPVDSQPPRQPRRSLSARGAFEQAGQDPGPGPVEDVHPLCTLAVEHLVIVEGEPVPGGRLRAVVINPPHRVSVAATVHSLGGGGGPSPLSVSNGGAASPGSPPVPSSPPPSSPGTAPGLEPLFPV